MEHVKISFNFKGDLRKTLSWKKIFQFFFLIYYYYQLTNTVSRTIQIQWGRLQNRTKMTSTLRLNYNVLLCQWIGYHRHKQAKRRKNKHQQRVYRILDDMIPLALSFSSINIFPLCCCLFFLFLMSHQTDIPTTIY